MKKVVSILVFLGMGAFISAQDFFLHKACYEIEGFELSNGDIFVGGKYRKFDERSICRAVYVADGKGWNSSDFEPYLRRYTIKYGDPIYKNTSQGHDMIWCWAIDKNFILNLRYLVPNSLQPAGIVIYITKK